LNSIGFDRATWVLKHQSCWQQEY